MPAAGLARAVPRRSAGRRHLTQPLARITVRVLSEIFMLTVQHGDADAVGTRSGSADSSRVVGHGVWRVQGRGRRLGLDVRWHLSITVLLAESGSRLLGLRSVVRPVYIMGNSAFKAWMLGRHL